MEYNIPLIPYHLLGPETQVVGEGTYGTVALHSNVLPQLKEYGLNDSRYMVKSCKDKPECRPTSSTITEFLMSCNFKHPRLATAVAYCVDDDRNIKLVFERYECSLRSYLNRNKCMGGIPDHIALSITKDIIEAVSFLHANNVAHYDIKMSNALVRYEDGKIRASLSDFGSCDMRMSQNEMCQVRTTINYTPPELLTTNPSCFGPAVDIWSIACIVYELYTNKYAIDRKSINSSINAIYSKLGPPTIEEQKFLTGHGVVLPVKIKNVISHPIRMTNLPLEKERRKAGYPVASRFIEEALTYIPSNRPVIRDVITWFDIPPPEVGTSRMISVNKVIDPSDLTNKITLNKFYMEIILSIRKLCIINKTLVSSSFGKSHLSYERFGDVFYAIEYLLLHSYKYPDEKIDVGHVACYFYLATCVNGVHVELPCIQHIPTYANTDLFAMLPRCLDVIKHSPVPVTAYDCLRWEYDPSNIMDIRQVESMTTKVNLSLFLLYIGGRYNYNPTDMYNLLYFRSPVDVRFIHEGMNGMSADPMSNEWRMLNLTPDIVRRQLTLSYESPAG